MFEPVGPGSLRLWRVARPGRLWALSAGAARWSLDGDPMIYASCSAALSVLEALAHLDRADAARPHRLGTLEVSVRAGDVLMLAPSALPARWKRRKTLTRGIGREWLSSGESTALLVPSALVGGEMNALIDAESPRWKQWLRRAQDTAYRFDPRVR